jgi:hypothetical protein
MRTPAKIRFDEARIKRLQHAIAQVIGRADDLQAMGKLTQAGFNNTIRIASDFEMQIKMIQRNARNS